jgi:hypothetical protein
MGWKRKVAVTVAVTAVLGIAISTKPTEAKPKPPPQSAVAVTVSIPPSSGDPAVYVPATLTLGAGVWHVVGEGTASDCTIPPATTGILLGDVAYTGGDARFPTLLVDAGTAGATVTIQCHGVGATADTTERLIGVPVVMQ